jgi:hypothetical protein
MAYEHVVGRDRCKGARPGGGRPSRPAARPRFDFFSAKVLWMQLVQKGNNIFEKLR